MREYTTDEIKKALLECSKDEGCDNCIENYRSWDCINSLEREAAILIEAQQKEIAGYKLLLEQQHPDIPEQKTDQMELPRMKNNDERKKFLDEYQKWPIWVNTPEMHEKIYRYDLPNGSIIAVRECEYYATWAEKVMTRAFYYLFGENVLQFNGTHKDIEYPWSGESNVTEIVNALRDVQRKQPSDK